MSIFTDFEKQGVLAGFSHDAWDDRLYSGIAVQNEDGSYLMAYTGYQSDGLIYGPCLATSDDFKVWNKPNLGQVSYGGNTNNNIIILSGMVGVQDLVIFDGLYVLLVRNDDSATNLIYTSPDRITWTFEKTVFSNTSHGQHIESKCILFAQGVYRIYYSQGHFSPGERRSLGYYESITLDGTWVDRGLVPEFTSTDQDIQFYDMKTWNEGDYVYACVPKYNKTTEVLGPLQLYQSGNEGSSWEYLGNIIDNGSGGEFDAGLIAAAKPIIVNDTWQMIYVGSSQAHNVWPRPMQFAKSTETVVATTSSKRFNRPITDTITDDDYLNLVNDPNDSAQNQLVSAATLKSYSSGVATELSATNAAGPAILDEAATITNPTIVPNKADSDTGIGWSTGGSLSCVSNGLTVIFFETPTTLSATETSLWLYDLDSATIRQVTVGADDSGGSGFKVLRIAN